MPTTQYPIFSPPHFWFRFEGPKEPQQHSRSRAFFGIGCYCRKPHRSVFGGWSWFFRSGRRNDPVSSIFHSRPIDLPREQSIYTKHEKPTGRLTHILSARARSRFSFLISLSVFLILLLACLHRKINSSGVVISLAAIHTTLRPSKTLILSSGIQCICAPMR